MAPTDQADIKVVVFAQKLLKICFLLPFDTFSNTVNITFVAVCQVWVFLNAAATMSLSIYQISNGFEDVNATIESAIGVFNYLSFVYISVCFTTQLEELKKIFYGIRIFNEFCDITVISRAEEKVQFYSKFLATYFCIGGFINVLLPVMNMSSCYESRESELYRKYDPCGSLVRSLYPFDTRSTFRKFSVNFSKASAVYFICTGFLGVTMVLTGLLIHIIAQIENLKEMLGKLFKENQDQKNEIQKKLRFCIRYHITIIRYTERVFNVYNLLILAHITITSLIFGLIIFLILRLDNYADKLRHAAHLAGWLAILFITCYYGQRVTDESTSIAEAAYSSLWYDAPASLQRDVGLMVLRAQRPLTLKAASYGVISLVTFLAVIKGAYSLTTVMLAVSD